MLFILPNLCFNYVRYVVNIKVKRLEFIQKTANSNIVFCQSVEIAPDCSISINPLYPNKVLQIKQ